MSRHQYKNRVYRSRHFPIRSLILFSVLLSTFSGSGLGAKFGTIVPIGGHVSDLAFDSHRGVVYIANFGAARIDVLASASNTLQEPIQVSPTPSSLAVSGQGRYLVVGHLTEPGITILDMNDQQRRTISLPSPVLTVSFGNGEQALVVTKEKFYRLDPLTGLLQELELSGFGTLDLPVEFAVYPPEIIQASSGVSGDGNVIYVLAEMGAAPVGPGEEESDGELAEQPPALASAIVQYIVSQGSLSIVGITANPPLGPRVVSVDQFGNRFLAAWTLLDTNVTLWAQFPRANGSFNFGTHAYDWKRGLVYAQVPQSEAPDGAVLPEDDGEGAVLEVFSVDNLTVLDRIQVSENLAGKSVFSADMETLYAASDSGVAVLPVGSLGQTPRLASVQEDLLFPGTACDRSLVTKEIQIVDRSGGSTDFSISGGGDGIRISPQSGTTPAIVEVTVDQTRYQNKLGTTTVPITITSHGAVNVPSKVRLLINTREPEQRGMIHNVPGRLVDLLADPVRNRFYVLRQDKNLVLVFDGSSFEPIALLRTGNTPVQMAMTRDDRYLLVSNDNSQIANVFDLETLEPSEPILFPGGHYPRSIAVSDRGMLASVRSAAGPHAIDRIFFEERIATTPPSLGIYSNDVSDETILAPSPFGDVIVGLMPEGTVLLYETVADQVIASREDVEEFSGAYSVITQDQYVAGDYVLNRSLVPQIRLENDTGRNSGFTLVGGFGARTTSFSMDRPGTITRYELPEFKTYNPTKTVESPILMEELMTPPVGQIGQTVLPFSRSLAALSNQSSIVSLSTSGLMELPWDFDKAAATPVVIGVANGADGTGAVAPGGLVAVSGTDLSAVSQSAGGVPLPKVLAEACVTIDDQLVPLFAVSPSEIRAQLPFGVAGGTKLVVRSPGGTSEPFELNISSGAPAVFHTGMIGDKSGLPTVFRVRNAQLLTLSNPVHPRELIVIYLTGLGDTSPAVKDGHLSPFDPLARTIAPPQVTLGGVALQVEYSGLVPGQIGVYQINAVITETVPEGMSVPLTVMQGGQSTTLAIRVVH